MKKGSAPVVTIKRDWSSRFGILLVGGILVVSNLIGLNVFLRLDFTDDQVYSLSDASKDLVRNLEDPVTLTAFFTGDLPPEFEANRRFLKDKLDDYRAYGGANVEYRFVDPSEDEALEAEAARYSIQPVQIQVVEENSVQLKNAYMGLALQYESKREVIPFVQDMSRLEYDITSSIRRMTREEKPMVGFLSGNGEPNPMQDMPILNEGLGANYDVRTVQAPVLLGDEKPDILMIVSPADTIPPEDLQAIDEFIMNGGHTAMLINRVSADLQMGQATELHTGIETLLEAYGATLTPNLIMDENNSTVTISRQQGFFRVQQQIQYPLFPVATNFNRENMMVSRLPNMMFYFVSSIDTTVVLPPGVTREPLIYSSNQSGEQRGFFMLQPTQTTASLSGGPFVLGAAYTGAFPSAFDPTRTGLPTRLVVIGDGDLFDETLLGAPAGQHAILGLNIVDWLGQDEAMLSIRAKSLQARNLREVGDRTKSIVKYSNMAGPILLVMLFGLVRWRRRRGRQIVVVQ